MITLELAFSICQISLLQETVVCKSVRVSFTFTLILGFLPTPGVTHPTVGAMVVHKQGYVII